MSKKKLLYLKKKNEINFPPNYSVANALRTAWLQIQEVKDLNNRPALEVCTRESIANAPSLYGGTGAFSCKETGVLHCVRKPATVPALLFWHDGGYKAYSRRAGCLGRCGV